MIGVYRLWKNGQWKPGAAFCIQPEHLFQCNAMTINEKLAVAFEERTNAVASRNGIFVSYSPDLVIDLIVSYTPPPLTCQ